MITIKQFFLLCFVFAIFFADFAQRTRARQHCSLFDEVEHIFFNSSDKSYSTTVDQFGEVIKIPVKKCTCGSLDYCPIYNGEDMCSVKRWRREFDNTLCYKSSKYRFYTTFLRSLWIPSLCLLAVLIALPFSTILGRNAAEFLISPCCPCLTRRRIDRMIQHEIELISQYITIQAPSLVQQTILKLKTKSMQDDDQKLNIGIENHCSICIAPLDKGETIGDLACGHSFHVDCLKEWLKRKNACPLCNGQVAHPRTVMVEREEVFSDDHDDVDEDAQLRFNRLLNYLRRRTTTRIHATFN